MIYAVITEQPELKLAWAAYNQELAKRAERGLGAAGDKLLELTLPITPIETGELRGGSFSRKESGSRGFFTVWVVGFTAPYAVYVHEISRYKHSPPTQYKFLEDTARTKQPEVVEAFNMEWMK